MARKWRPKNFSEVRGQEHICRTLVNSIKNQKIAQAYLLTGTRGIGKTTVARIFAKAIRCENLSTDGNPCLACPSCLEIDGGHSLNYLEIDGASNNSVDDMRELIESVQYLPTNGKYKVYVIDEVHMLSVSAFNALLKTLEEPPEHVVFIFATTDPQKLLGTVLSRCQRFDFKNSTIDETQRLLIDIAKEEGIEFETEAIPKELAKQGKGSFRDSLSLLDQLISLSDGTHITEKNLMLSLGVAQLESVMAMIEALFTKNKELAYTTYQSVLNENIDIKKYSSQVLEELYQIILNTSESGEIKDSKISPEVLSNVTLIEVMWIYENLVRDLDWSLKSFDAEQASCLVFVKMTLREHVINHSSPELSVKKKYSEKLEEPKVTKNIKENEIRPSQDISDDVIKQEIEKEIVPKQIEEKSWEGFLKFLLENNKPLAINLERGNLTQNFDENSDPIVLKIGFSLECKVFHDYLVEKEVQDQLKVLLQDYLNKSNNISLQFEIMDENTAKEANFKSIVDIEVDKEKAFRDEQREKIVNNKFIKSAEELFGSKIDKIVLNEDN